MDSAPIKNIFRILEFYNANRDAIDILDLVESCTTSRSSARSKDFFVKIGTESVPISFVGNKILGQLKGAYTSNDPDGQERIYLNSDWLIKADKEEIEAVILEEIGHAIDHRVNGNNDTPGDEGAIFSALVRGKSIDESQINEDDHFLINIDGKSVVVEASANIQLLQTIKDGDTLNNSKFSALNGAGEVVVGTINDGTDDHLYGFVLSKVEDKIQHIYLGPKDADFNVGNIISAGVVSDGDIIDGNEVRIGGTGSVLSDLEFMTLNSDSYLIATSNNDSSTNIFKYIINSDKTLDISLEYSASAPGFGLDAVDTIQFNGYALSATVARDLGDGADPETTGTIIISDISNPALPVEKLRINGSSSGITRIDSPRDVEFIEIGSNLYVAWAHAGAGGHIAKLDVTGSGTVTLEEEVLFTGNSPTKLDGEPASRASNLYDIEFFEHNDSGTTKQLMSWGAPTILGGHSIIDITGVNSSPASIESFSHSEWPTLNGVQFKATSQEIFQLGGSNYVAHTSSTLDQILINDLGNPRQLEQVAFLDISSGDHLNGVSETTTFNSGNSAILMSASILNDSVSFYKLSPDPSITSSTYDATSGQLVVDGDFPSNSAGSDIDVSKLTVRGEGNSTYTLTSADVNRTTRNEFTITLNAADQLALAGILNNDGTTSDDGTTYSIEAAEDWSLGSDTADTIADTSGNAVTVSNTPAPSITSATYDFSTGVISVSGSNFPGKIGLNNDIDVSKLAVTGDENGSYTLTTSDVDVSSSTTFTITLNTADRIAVSGLLNKDGTSSADSTTYNLLASDDWAAGAKSSLDIVDASNSITVSSYALPQVSSAEYYANLGVLKVFASNLPGELGPNNDIDTTKIVITGGSSADYTLTTANVEVTSRTEFTISLNDADKLALSSVLDKDGLSSVAGTTYNLALADDWAKGADATANISDLTSNAIVVNSFSNIAPTLTAPLDGLIKEVANSAEIESSRLTGTLSASDLNNDILKYSVTGGTLHLGVWTKYSDYGYLTVNESSGVYEYVPDATAINKLSSTITDVFEMIVDDGHDSDSQSFTVTIQGLNDQADIAGDLTKTGPEETNITGTVTATDIDGLTDGSYFTITGAPTNGSATIGNSTGAWTYTPNEDYFGTDAFTITVTDDLGGTTTQQISLSITNVDDPSLLSGDLTKTVPEDTTTTGTVTATDVEGLTDSTYFTVSTAPTNGSATIGISSGFWSYTPNDHYYGTDEFTVTVTDDLGGTTNHQIQLSVNNTNDPTLFSGDLNTTGAEDTTTTGTVTATDIDGLTDGSYFTITGAPTNGTATIGADTGIWTYTPNDDYFGTDAFTITVTDDLGGTTIQQLSLSITNADDPSLLSGDLTKTGVEDTEITGTVTATDIDGLTDGSYFTITTAPTNGSATIGVSSGFWSYTPNDHYYGTDEFTVTVTDDLGGTTANYINLSVTNDNDPTLFSGDLNGTIAEDYTITGEVTATDIDGLTDGSYFTITGAPTNGTATIGNSTGAWAYTPNDDYFGSDSFTINVTDDLGGTTTQQISLSIINVDDPTLFFGDLQKEGYEESIFLGSIQVSDKDGLTNDSYIAITTAPSNGVALIDTSSGAWSYTPKINYFGTDDFEITITDDTGSATTQKITLNVLNIDDPYSVYGQTSGELTKPGEVVSGQLNVSDPDSSGHRFSIAPSGSARSGLAQITSTGEWTYAPDNAFSDNDSFEVKVLNNDGEVNYVVINIDGSLLNSPSNPPTSTPPPEPTPEPTPEPEPEPTPEPEPEPEPEPTPEPTHTNPSDESSEVLIGGNSGKESLSVKIPAQSSVSISDVKQDVLPEALISEFSSSLNPPEGSSIELLSTFVQTLPDETKVDIAVIVPTELSSNLSDTLVIQNTSPQSSTLVEAVHIDATGVVDASIELNNIEFASISGDVRVIGGLGKNFVAADSGNQYIKLGKDDDTIYGGGGDDTVGSAGGIDRIFGDIGDDLVFGGRGADILSGGIGNDILKGGRGNDRVDGDDGLDSIRGGPGNDQIYGGAGSDILWGNRGDDELIGNAFNDTIYGGSGSDEIDGGRGVDTSFFKGKRSSYTINNKGNYFEVVKTKGQYAGEVDRLNNIEFMQFKDSVAPLHKNYFMYSLIEVDGSIDLLADSDGNLFASNEKARDPIACIENAVPISKSSGEWDVLAAEIYGDNNIIIFGNSSLDLLVYEMDSQWNKISESLKPYESVDFDLYNNMFQLF